MSNPNYDILIIGGGPAGIFATSFAHIKGLKPLLIEANNYLGGQPQMIYSQKNIHDYPGYASIKAYQLMDNLIAQLNHYRLPYFVKTTITKLTKQKEGFTISLSNKQTIKVKNIVIATGPGIFTPNKLTIPHKETKNIQYGVEPLNSYRNKKVIILGGGDSAVDWANEISQVTKNVIIIHRRNEFRANGENVKNLKINKIKIYLNSVPCDLKNKQLTIKNTTTNKCTKLTFDFLIIQYGQMINPQGLKSFSGLNINNQNRIPVNASQQTNIENIYAIGNVCIYDGKPSNIICAHGEAVVAVRHILNKIKQYDRK